MTNEWIKVGARVAEYTSGNSDGGSVRFAVIERLTATQIVLGNGRRYNRVTLHRVGEDRSGWGPRAVLEDVASERVKAAYAAEAISNALYKISIITRGGLRGVAVLDEVDRLVAEARKRIENMTTD